MKKWVLDIQEISKFSSYLEDMIVAKIPGVWLEILLNWYFCCTIYIHLGGTSNSSHADCIADQLKYNFQRKGIIRFVEEVEALNNLPKKEIKHVLRHILGRIEWLPMSSSFASIVWKGSLQQ